MVRTRTLDPTPDAPILRFILPIQLLIKDDHTVDPINYPTPTCDRCDTGAIQDAKHIFTQCPAFATLRQEVFENFEPDDLSKITDHQLGRFISESNYRWFPQEEEPEDPG